MNHYHRVGDSPILVRWTYEDLDAYLAETFSKSSLEEVVSRLLRIRLPDEVAERRAPMIIKDMCTVGFQLQLDPSRAAPSYYKEGLPVPIQYYIPDPKWTINHADPAHAIEGTHLNKGDLVLLSKTCELGRKHVPTIWPDHFESELTTEHHLSCINEIWWLGRFRNPQNIKKLDGKKTKSSAPDWEFIHESQGISFRIRLEVKRRPSDVRRHAGLSEERVSLDKIAKKFKSAAVEDINLAAISMYSAINQQLVESAKIWLESESKVDGIIFWSQEARSSPSLAWVARNDIDGLLKDILQPPDEEDSSGIAVIQHTQPNVSLDDLFRFYSE